jgi:hypothetical protein
MELVLTWVFVCVCLFLYSSIYGTIWWIRYRTVWYLFTFVIILLSIHIWYWYLYGTGGTALIERRLLVVVFAVFVSVSIGWGLLAHSVSFDLLYILSDESAWGGKWGADVHLQCITFVLIFHVRFSMRIRIRNPGKLYSFSTVRPFFENGLLFGRAFDNYCSKHVRLYVFRECNDHVHFRCVLPPFSPTKVNF